VIDVAGNNFRVGNLRLGIINANSYVTSAGLNITDQANAAYGQANSARSDANTTFATINTTFGTVNTSLGTINTSYQAAYAQANTAGTNALNAYGQANAAYGAANNRVLKAGDTMTGQLNISSGGLLVTGNVGIGITGPVAGLHINTSTRSLSLASPASGGGGASYIIMGNNDSGGTAGPNLITAANRGLSFGVGDSFSSASGGTMTTFMHITGGGLVGIGNNNPSVNLHITQAVPSGVGSVPAGTGLLLENTGNNYITLRHSANAGRYSGLVFMDNNIGGYIIHGDGASGDKLYLAGYGGVEIQQGTDSSVTPGARTTIGNFTSTGLTVTGTITETSSIRIKKNINPITDALQTVLSINGYTYDRIDGTAKQRAGLLAEEINDILPNVVQKDAQGLPYGIQYTNLIAYLIEAIKELKTEIDSLKKNGTVS
jgi:hypothetical protein